MIFLAGALSIPQKLENAKMNLQISIKGGVKLKKHEGEGGVTDKMGLKIFTSKIWKKYSPKISPLFSDAAGAHISDLWPYFHFLILLHLLYAQMGPFSFVEKNYV